MTAPSVKMAETVRVTGVRQAQRHLCHLRLPIWAAAAAAAAAAITTTTSLTPPATLLETIHL
ncbi:hypothetical protein E2C01_022234 [Portunus trituberculatus]|uniref:Uncharacterized protein n=1 Tax=Portunus trituberculatus TaxID=210409 RepID=A0A5B7E5F8_PORTR|nr:hypothetical protein [Portunus trituberculatus]